MIADIRRVTIEEVDLLLQLSRQTFFDAFAHLNSVADMDIYASEAFTLPKIKSEIDHPYSSFYFIHSDNQIAGYLKLNTGTAQTEFKNDNALEIERIYISAQYQRNNLGKQLLNFAIEQAQNLKRDYIWLGVWENNHNAINFYQKNGFEQFSRHYFMLGNDKQTDILMRKFI